MEYQEDVEMSPIPRTPNLKPSEEDQYWLGALIFLEHVLTQVVDRMGEKPTSPAQGTLAESITESKYPGN